jgi:hypothetical protein
MILRFQPASLQAPRQRSWMSATRPSLPPQRQYSWPRLRWESPKKATRAPRPPLPLLPDTFHASIVRRTPGSRPPSNAAGRSGTGNCSGRSPITFQCWVFPPSRRLEPGIGKVHQLLLGVFVLLLLCLHDQLYGTLPIRRSARRVPFRHKDLPLYDK